MMKMIREEILKWYSLLTVYKGGELKIPAVERILRHHQSGECKLTFPLSLFLPSQSEVLVPPSGYVTKARIGIRCEERKKTFVDKEETLANRNEIEMLYS